MNMITMIPVEQLHHHPKNPRLDLGDLTELTESIKSQGVLQNLTVVPDEDGGFLVLIGNRRMEAAKLAGLEALPCAVVEMDETDQIATMLTENMHRTDLTLYEQAQGMQMMMDLGLSEGQISDMTGFSRTTVKRRLKMAELDRETLKEKCAQLTIEDMDQLNKVEDIEKRNQLLKEAGGSSFKWKVDNAISEQKRLKIYQQIRAVLLQAGCIEKSTSGVKDFWNKYEYLPYSTRITLDAYTDGQSILPEDERQLYFYMEYDSVRFWTEKREEEEEDEEPDEEETAEEKAKKKETEDAWTRLKEIEQHAKDSRAEFLGKLTIKQKDNRKALEWMMIGMVISNNAEMAITRLMPDLDEEQIKELPEGQTEADLGLKWIREQVETNPQLYAQAMDGLFFDGEDCVFVRWRTSEKPQYCRNLSLITGYEWLEDFGYRISDDERAYLDGTLDCYGEAEE